MSGDGEKEGKLAKYVRRFDFFGVTIPFRMDGKRTYQSIINGGVFIIYALGVIAYCLYNFINYASFKEFKYIFSQNKLYNPPEGSFVTTKTGIAISLTKNGVIDTSILKYVNMKGEAISSVRSLAMNPNYVNTTCMEVPCKSRAKLVLDNKCTLKDFYAIPRMYYNTSDPNYTKLESMDAYNQITQDMFEEERLDQWNCLNMSVYNITGQYENNLFNYYSLEVSLKPGLNQTEVQDARDLFAKYEYKIEFKFSDSNFDIFNKSAYVVDFMNSDFLNIDYAFTKRKNFYFEKSDLASDTNPFFQTTDEKNYTILSMGPKEEYFMFRGEDRYSRLSKPGDDSIDGMVLAKIYFRSSPDYTSIKLAYYKFTEFIADTTSISQMILVALFFFCSAINEMLSFRMMMIKTLKFKKGVSFENENDFHHFQSLFAKDIKTARKHIRTSLVFPELQPVGLDNNVSAEINGQPILELNEINRQEIKALSDAESMKSSKENSINLKEESNIVHNVGYVNIPENNDDKFEQSVLRARTINLDNSKEIETISIEKRSAMKKSSTSGEKFDEVQLNRSEASPEPKKPKGLDSSNIDEEEVVGFSKGDVVKKVFFNFFCAFCKNCELLKKDKGNDEYNLFKKGKHQLTYYMDFLTYIRKMQELDILKYILLDKDQRKLFNFVSRPSVDTNRTDIYALLHQKFNVKTDEFNIAEIESLHKSYKEVSSKKETNLNSKLVQLADIEIDFLANKNDL